MTITVTHYPAVAQAQEILSAEALAFVGKLQ